jgi:tRNA-2-methylthio-N6-dimethylallyladenosine synthase
MKSYFIKTFGCQQNVADSERMASFYESRGFVQAQSLEDADTVILNTCVIRDKAEEKVYGFIRSLKTRKTEKNESMPHIVVTGCLIGSAAREPSGKMMKRLTSRLPEAEILPLEDVGFEHAPKREEGKVASIVISNGCNNFCAFCIVPFARGKERSRAFEEIIEEVQQSVVDGHDEIMLLGQNVNSYGADILMDCLKKQDVYILPSGQEIVPVMVKHLNRHRIPTMFPQLLEAVASIEGVRKVRFLASNPWDFSDELIAVIKNNLNIDRVIHLPVQAGSNEVLKRMNRWYTREEYLALIERIKTAIPEVEFTTDIIVGFPGETEEQFQESISLAKTVGFRQTFIAWYSPRPGTAAAEGMEDTVSIEDKQRRYHELDAVCFQGFAKANAHNS